MGAFQVAEQKRLSYRARVTWPVVVETTGGSVNAETRDISAEGAHIRCNQHMALDEPVQMTIKPPDREPLKVAATVMWSNCTDESEQPRVIGVRFTEISEEDRHFLLDLASQYLRSRITKT